MYFPFGTDKKPSIKKQRLQNMLPCPAAIRQFVNVKCVDVGAMHVIGELETHSSQDWSDRRAAENGRLVRFLKACLDVDVFP